MVALTKHRFMDSHVGAGWMEMEKDRIGTLNKGETVINGAKGK